MFPIFPPLLSSNISQHSTPDTAPPAYSSNRSPSPETFTPQTRPPIASKSSSDSTSAPSRTTPAAPTPKSEGSAVSSSVPTYDELKARLADAQATIASYAQEGGLKMRAVAKGETSSKAVNDAVHTIQAQGAQGVPLQIVAALCLISFLLAYLFF